MSENKPKNPLIKYTELAGNLENAVARDELNAVLMKPPRQDWIKKHPIIKVEFNGQKVPLEYLPIDKVRMIAKAIFQRTRREIREIKQIAQSIVAIVRVHYRDPLTGEWDWQDGVGAIAIQLKKDAPAFDLTQINSNAIQLGAPAAVSYAYKNAYEEVGAIFGTQIQKEFIEFAGMYAGYAEKKEDQNPPEQQTESPITTNF